MRRLVVFSPSDEFKAEIAEADVFSRVRTERVNGEHSLTITTSAVLGKEDRILTRSASGKWREYVVTGVDAEHSSGLRAIGTYYCVWSLQHDMSVTVVSCMPGVRTPVNAMSALSTLLEGSRWQRGSVTVTSTGGASMYMMSAWEALGVLTEVWGGEVDAEISVDTKAGVVTRKVSLWDKQGSQSATRRFDWDRDLSAVKRTVSDAPLPCRIIPLGKGEETGGGGHGRKTTIESVNSGRNYLENSDTARSVRMPKGNGAYEYPTVIVENSEIETPAELKAWAQSVLEEHTTPKVTYEASVVQLADAGMDVTGVALGDVVHVVDKGFGPSALRVEGRVVEMVVNELDDKDVGLKIGNFDVRLSDAFSALDARLSKVSDTVQAVNGGTFATADYLSRLLDRINAEVNATGGYTYITQGHGVRTYDRAVSDPLVGAEASSVVEIKGGTIRIANSKTPSGDWEWKTVFQSGHIAANMVTAANITAGYIGSADSGNFWDLDGGSFQMANTAQLGNTTVGGLVVKTEDQWYQSNSTTYQTGGAWTDSQSALADGKHLWTRRKYTLNDGTVTHGTPVLAATVEGAYSAVNDLDAMLNQREVFNRLTNNGASHGIYLNNGQLYINGEYIQADTVALDKLKSKTSQYSYVKMRSVDGYDGMAFYDKSNESGAVSNYFSILSMADTDEGRKLDGVGFTVNSRPFLYARGKSGENRLALFAPTGIDAMGTIWGGLKSGVEIREDTNSALTYIALASKNVAVKKNGNISYGYSNTIELNIPGATSAASGGTWYPDNPTWRTLRLTFVNGICTYATLD